ncbi:protein DETOXIFICATION 35-like isoform X2 [Prosopis cineraria]|uniref:protein DETOXIFICATION 35-like isoform X2 n=1 Tax=Prosopis cineraria TaxID=364024 RepID=UPI00240FBCF2|nr:protein DETOXIFICATION 35-like isoform X2 [Prosopis cineraria]
METQSSSTPLLNGTEEAMIADDGDYAPIRNLEATKKVIWIESVRVWKIAVPIAFNLLCNFSIIPITSMFVGHLGNLELSAVAISLSVIGTFTFSLMLGMGSALETLCGQAFGAGQVHMLGVYMQRSCIILFVACFILLPVFIFATPILKLLGQEDEIADLAGVFSIKTIPRLFSLAFIFPTQKFLQAQSKVNVLTLIGFMAVVTHVFLLWLFIYVLHWGTTGAAVACDMSFWLIALSQIVYVVGWCKEGWQGLSMLAFKDIWAFTRLSLSSGIMICFEIWYLMSLVLLTGHLHDAVIAVDSLSICVRVSNELGMGHPRTAKYSVYVTVTESLLLGILFMAVVLIARKYIALPFTTSATLQEAVASLAYLLAITMLLNSVQQSISGVAVGGGWQALVAYINVGCYYIFGLPLGIVLGYVADLGVKGLWGGMLGGIALQTLMLLFLLYKINWNREVEQATERIRSWGGQDMKNDGAEKIEEHI